MRADQLKNEIDRKHAERAESRDLAFSHDNPLTASQKDRLLREREASEKERLREDLIRRKYGEL